VTKSRVLAALRALVGAERGEEKPSKESQEAAETYPEITAANQRLRDTAKWILASFGAVGAIVVAGLQLSSVGELTGQSATSRLVAAFLGIALAALGVGVAIWFTSSVLAPFLNNFRSADEHPDVTRRVLSDKELVGATYDELKEAIEKADRALDKAETKGRDSPEYEKALCERDELEKDKQLALTVIGSELLADRFARARHAVAAGIILVIVGVVAFAWGANPPSPEAKESLVILGQAPLALRVHLTPAGVVALQETRSCTKPDLDVLSISGKPAQREVVTVPTEACKSVRFVLTPDLGTAIAVSSQE
jgi:hypothetical protein